MDFPYQLVTTDSDHLASHPKQNYLNYYIFALGYTQAVLNLYAGPLFANLIAGDLLDCAVWGVSPIIFFFMQPYLLLLITSGSNPYRRRFVLLTVSTMLLGLSYAALNYSEKFKWNYLTRLVNLDCGYIILDLNLKIVNYIFSVQDQQIKTKQHSKAAEVVKYHRLTFLAELVCYTLALYLCLYGKVGHEHYHWSLWRSSLIGCILVLPIPGLYYYKNKFALSHSYMECPQREGVSEEQFELEFKKAAKVQLGAYFLMRFSLLINLAYSTLWIMTGMLSTNIPENRAFMQSVKTGSLYFLVSCILSYLVGYFLKHFISRLKCLTCVFSVTFGAFLILTFYNFTIEGFGACIILSGVQLALVNHYEAITQLQHLTSRIVLAAEIAAFCLIPIVITFCTQIEQAEIFVLLSGCACLLASVLLVFI